MRTSRIAALLLPLAALMVLQGCGGSSDSDLTSVQGNVADGYLENARVCLDLNGNRTCDDGEPTDTTDAEGAYRLEGVAPRWLDEAPIIAEVVAGATLNHEDGGSETVDRGYILSTPPGAHRFAPGDGRVFISPLTSMVHERMTSFPAMTIRNAADIVRARVATNADPFEDYIARQADSADSDEYARLHRIARATAVALGDQMELFSTTAEENAFPYETAALYAAALRQVQGRLLFYAQRADTDDGSFDPELVVEENPLTPDAAEVQYKLERMAIPAVAADQQEVYAEGIYRADFSVQDGNLVAEYTRYGLGAQQSGGAFELDRTVYRYDLNSAAWAQVPAEDLQADYHLHLTPEGWERCDPTIEGTLAFQDDNSLLWTDVPTNLGYDERMSVRDVSGRPINAFLLGSGVSAADTAKFPEGSLFYDVISIPRQDIYTLNPSQRIPLSGSPLDGIVSVREIPEKFPLPFDYEIRQVMGEEILIYFLTGSPEAPQEETVILVLRDGELWGGDLEFAGIPQTYSNFNRTALDAMTAALTAASPD